MEAQPDWVSHLSDTDRLEHTRVPELCQNNICLEFHWSFIIVWFYTPHKKRIASKNESKEIFYTFDFNKRQR